MDIQSKIKEAGLLDIIVENAAACSVDNPKAFTLIRRVGFGASDASTLLGVNLYTKLPELIKQKCSTEITDEELKVGELENVRKGRDLEPLILQKFLEFARVVGLDLCKPEPMYRIKQCPSLTINFDGVIEHPTSKHLVPVEAKYVSKYAGKFWDKTKALDSFTDVRAMLTTEDIQGCTMKDWITHRAKQCGIPPYYYTQVQQQLLGLDAPFGYLVSLWDAGWELNVFLIPRDLPVQHALMERSTEAWNMVQLKKECQRLQ